MGALELKMFLDVLGDRELTLDRVSNVLLRLSELLEVEGHNVESMQARDLSLMVEGDVLAAGQIEDVLVALDCDTFDDFDGKEWTRIPDGVSEENAEAILELFASGVVKIPED
jgi:hypothetical protein